MKRDPSLIRFSRDHNRGLVVAVRVLREAPSANEEQLAKLISDVLDFWQTALLPHFRAECECLLARLARQLAIDDALITRIQSDHLRLNALRVSLEERPGLASSRELLQEMAERLRDHIRWEEAVLFEQTPAVLGADFLRLLGDDLAQRIPEVPAAPPWA